MILLIPATIADPGCTCAVEHDVEMSEITAGRHGVPRIYTNTLRSSEVVSTVIPGRCSFMGPPQTPTASIPAPRNEMGKE